MRVLLALLLLSLLVQPLAAGPCADMQQDAAGSMPAMDHVAMAMDQGGSSGHDSRHDCCEGMPEGQVDCSTSQACSLLYLTASPLSIALQASSAAPILALSAPPPVLAPSLLLRPPIS